MIGEGVTITGTIKAEQPSHNSRCTVDGDVDCHTLIVSQQVRQNQRERLKLTL